MSEITLEWLLDRFWEWRKPGRSAQTLHQDLVFFLTAWQADVGWKMCSDLYALAMAKREWDIEQGGYNPPPAPAVPAPRKKKPGLMAYV